MSKHRYRFRQVDSIGSNDAESDRDYLKDCFVDTGLLETLEDTITPQRIVLGRTGAGKSALLFMLEQRVKNPIRIEPESLAISHVSNSTILQWLNAVGVKLDIFFKLLWRHVLAVEMLQREIDDVRIKQKSSNRIQAILGRIKSPTKHHQRAIEYLETWGDTFWEKTEYRIHEVSDRLEKQISAKLGERVAGPLSIEAARKLSHEERKEVLHRAQAVVNEVQIRELSDIIELTHAVLRDSGKTCHVIIDGLDQNWVEDRVRYKLIRSLIETTRDFQKAPSVKIVLALRVDLIERVFRLTRDAGFQEEKYEALFLPVTWSSDQLIEVLGLRVAKLIRHVYMPTALVELEGVLPNHVGGVAASKYIIDRTTKRPRDAIQFLNECILESTGEVEISSDAVRHAETRYSRKRLKSLYDEWVEDYRALPDVVAVFKKCPSQFKIGKIDEDTWLDKAIDIVERLEQGDLELDDISSSSIEYTNARIDVQEYRGRMVRLLYHIGFLGAKTEGYESMSWSTNNGKYISSTDVVDDTSVAIHPAYWQALGIVPPRTDG